MMKTCEPVVINILLPPHLACGVDHNLMKAPICGQVSTVLVSIKCGYVSYPPSKT